MNRADKAFAGLGALWLAAFAALALTAPPRAFGIALDELTLTAAAHEGDAAAVAALLARGADVGAQDPDGATALHWAVYHDDHAMAERLIKAGADVRAANRFGATPLSLAAINGSAEMIAQLLDAGADVNARGPNGETALMLAARTGRADAVELLLARGAEVDAREDLRETTALMWAAANHNAEAVRVLLAHGADLSLKSGAGASSRGPYLAPTARSRIQAYRIGYGEEGRAPGVTEIERLRARASLLDQDAQDALAALAREGADVAPVFDEEPEPDARRTGRSAGGLTALVLAVREGDAETARILLDAGADVNQTTDYNWTPLLTAVQNRYYKLAAELLERGADPNIANGGGWTPLYIAVDNRNIEGGDYPTRRPDMDHLAMIRLLLEHGADPNMRMASSTETRTVFTNQWLHEEGATPFLRAAQSGDLVLIRLLLAYGADPTIATEAGVTPLMVASGIGWVEGITYEWSPEQTYEVVELLLKLGADVNAQDTVDGRTALMGAAHKGRPDVVQLLVDHGADLDARDIGSRDSVHKLYGARWRAIDYADGLVRVGVQSSVAHPETATLLRRLMIERGLEPPPEGRTLDSICIVEICQPPVTSG